MPVPGMSGCVSALSHTSTRRKSRTIRQPKSRALKASSEALAVVEEESESEELCVEAGNPLTAAGSVLREEARSTCGWHSPDISEELPPAWQSAQAQDPVPQACDETASVGTDRSSISELVSLPAVLDENLSLSDVESCASLCYSESEVGSESSSVSEAPTLFSVSDAFVEKLRSESQVQENKSAPEPQHFDLAGDDEEDAEEEYFPSNATDAFAIKTVESQEQPAASPSPHCEENLSRALRDTQSASLSIADKTLPPFPLAFAPGARREAYVVTQPEPAGVPNKKKILPVCFEHPDDPMCSPKQSLAELAASFGQFPVKLDRATDGSMQSLKVC
jgi:hypothetical protein